MGRCSRTQRIRRRTRGCTIRQGQNKRRNRFLAILGASSNSWIYVIFALFVEQEEKTRLAAAEPTAFTNADRKELGVISKYRPHLIAFAFMSAGM